VLVAPEGAQTVTAQETTPASLVSTTRQALALAGVPIAGGTDMYFCELNRTRPHVEAMNGVFWSLNPQVHAFDDLSILETPEAQGDQVRTAREFAEGKSLFVGPVTLKRRYNVNATESSHQGESPDPRQGLPINLAWTAASLKHMSDQGADAVTYFEMCGPGGVIAYNEPFPVYDGFAQICELRGASVLSCTTTSPLEVAGLAVLVGGSMTLLAINLTPSTRTVEVDGDGFHRTIELAPYGLSRIDPKEGVSQ
jgi:hypothetical protein